MYMIYDVNLETVKAVYSGPEHRVWELIMGTQIHIGGLKSTLALAEAAQIQPGTHGVDLCCCTGAGMRALMRFIGVERMTGVDATPAMIELGRLRSDAQLLDGRIDFVHADACDSGLDSGIADFVWGEDAWCYVADKPALIKEAARLVRPGGVVAFTDWVAAGIPMTEVESKRLLKFMKFPNIATLDEYAALLRSNGLVVTCAVDTERFAPYADLYLEIIDKQLTCDVLELMQFNEDEAEEMAAGMRFLRTLAREGKLAQGMCVAVKSAGEDGV